MISNNNDNDSNNYKNNSDSNNNNDNNSNDNNNNDTNAIQVGINMHSVDLVTLLLAADLISNSNTTHYLF